MASYSSYSFDSSYNNEKMDKLQRENIALKQAYYELCGNRWDIEDRGPGKYFEEGRVFKSIDRNEQKVRQLQVCINVMANVISEYIAHLKKCAMPYMEAYNRNDSEYIDKHNKAFMPNHVKGIVSFQKYIMDVMNDMERDPSQFDKLMKEISQEERLKQELQESYDSNYTAYDILRQDAKKNEELD
jgi:hypothetical protein